MARVERNVWIRIEAPWGTVACMVIHHIVKPIHTRRRRISHEGVGILWYPPRNPVSVLRWIRTPYAALVVMRVLRPIAIPVIILII